MKRVYFIRHGETEGNIGGFSQTSATPLTERGQQQAVRVSDRFTSLKIDEVWASSYDRAQKTAQPIAEVCNCEVLTSPFFHETIKPSKLAGKPHDSDEYKEFTAMQKIHYTDPSWRMEDGENFEDVLTRVSDGIRSLEEAETENIVLVSHGRLLRFIVSYLIHQKNLTADIELTTSKSMVMTNTGITVFDFDGDTWKLLTWNDHAHFAE